MSVGKATCRVLTKTEVNKSDLKLKADSYGGEKFTRTCTHLQKATSDYVTKKNYDVRHKTKATKIPLLQYHSQPEVVITVDDSDEFDRIRKHSNASNGSEADTDGVALGCGADLATSDYLRAHLSSMFHVADNKLAMKLFGNKNALLKEKLRQKAVGNCVIHPCSNFRFGCARYKYLMPRTGVAVRLIARY